MNVKDEWATPQSLFDALDQEFGFTLDPCSTHENAKCAKHYTAADDGLAQDWGGETVFMNPPYGREIGKWMKKAFDEHLRGATIVALVPSRTNPPWWHDYVMKADEIRFIRKKVAFSGDKQGVPFWGSVLVVFNMKRQRPIVTSFSQVSK